MTLQTLLRVLTSSTAKSGYSFALSGLSFAAANLILAHNLPVEQYAILALLVAIVMLGSSIGMLGADGVVNRHVLAADFALFSRVIISCALVAFAAAWLTLRGYGVRLELVALLIPVIAAFGIARFCGAYLQSRMHFISSLLVFNSFNYLLLAVAISSYFVAFNGILAPFVILAVLQVLFAVVSILLVRTRFRTTESQYRYSWREALAFLAMASCSGVLVQLERLVAARVLDLRDLAVLGVLLAIVGPPFRLVYLAFGYDLLPALRQARKRSRKIALMLRQLVMAIAVMLPLWPIIWFGVPFVQQVYLSPEYEMSGALILATLITGTIKGFSGIAQASVTALADIKRMELMGAIGWISVAVAIVAAWYGSRFGLAGVLYGVSVGWLLRSVAAIYVVASQLDDDHAVVTEMPGAVKDPV